MKVHPASPPRIAIALLLLLISLSARPAVASGPKLAPSTTDPGASSAAFERTPPPAPPDPCTQNGLDASPSRPTWTGGASTSECGQLQSDFGWLLQPVGGGVSQWMLPASIRYGLTPRIELRWGLPTHMEQGSGAAHLTGASDQFLSVLYRFHEQGNRSPALAFNYGAKIASANPRKGFGTGFTDHQMTFIASRDVGRVHFDFNAVGTSAGCERGHDEAIQFGLALSVPANRWLTWVMDNFGGSQPGTSDRYGAELIGGTLALRPWLVLDAAYTRAYTAGSPRQQFTVGITHSARLGVLPLPSGSRLVGILRR